MVWPAFIDAGAKARDALMEDATLTFDDLMNDPGGTISSAMAAGREYLAATDHHALLSHVGDRPSTAP